jgi:HSP20 family protein
MKNRILKTALLATIPMVALQADRNLTINDPFANDPTFKHFQKLHKQMNRIFEEFNQDFFDDVKIDPTFKSHFFNRLGTSPKTDFVDKGKSYELKIDLPGVDEKAIKIDIKDGLISIEAKTEQKKEQKEDDKIIRQERFVGMIHRTLSLPKDANPDSYKSSYKNGVLTIDIEKSK